MEYEISVGVANIVLWNFFAMIINVFAFIIMYMKANHNASLKAFFVVQFSMIIWLLGKILKTVSPTVELRWLFVVVYYFGISLLGVSFLNFAYIYSKGHPIKKKLRIFLYTIALMQFILVVTNPYHYLFYSYFNFFSDDFGKLFYLTVGINYFFIITGMLLCGKKFSKQLASEGKFKKNIITFAILTPLIFNIIYITRLWESQFVKLGMGRFIFDITPIVYTWSILIFVYATFKYEFFSLTPIMKHEIASRLDTPILILDYNLEVLYTNDKFNNDFMERHITNLVKQLDLSYENEAIMEYQNKFYKYHVTFMKSINRRRYLIALTDISSYQYAKKELNRENEQLDISNKKLENQIAILKETSHVGARNFIARELHDILGHSLVLTIKLLEVSKMFYKVNKERACESLEKAQNSIKNGFNEMKNIKNKDITQSYNSAILERELGRMIKLVDISGLKVNFFFRGENKYIEERIYNTVKKIATELVTNSLKHSNADKLLLSISILDDKIVMQVMDNGIGVKNIVKGNGLIGIDGRLSLVGGKARYSSGESEGFTSNILIPL